MPAYRSLFVTALCAFMSAAIAGRAETLTSLRLGDAVSEQAARLSAVSAPIETAPEIALGEPGRRLLPAAASLPASLAFDVRLDPNAQNYLTLRLWGSDANWTPVDLLTDSDSVSLGNLWWHVTREAPVPGRFLYRTFPLPIEVTRGKTSLRLRIATAPAPQAIGVFRNADQPAPQRSYRPSFAFYGIHTHTDSWFQPSASERQGPSFAWGPPAPKPAGYPDTVEARLLQRARADIARSLAYGVARSRYDTGHRYDTRVLETLPLIYFTEWSGHYREKSVAEKTLAGIDAHVLRQAAQGGAPGAMFYRGWGSHGRIAHACSQMHEVFAAEGWLDQPLSLVTPSGTRAVSRRQAYADFFHDAFNWRLQDRRSWTNQPVYVSHTLYRLQKALRVLGDPRALTEAQALHYLHVSYGLEPMRSRPGAMDVDDAGYPYFLTTRAGLTREKGYVDAYGELSDVLVPIAEETGDPVAYEFARKFMRARSVFRIPSNDTTGNGMLRGIGAMSWRGTTFPFRVFYSGIEEAAVLGDPVSLRLAQLEIAHGRLHLLPAEPERGPHWHPASSIRLVDQYRKIKDLPPSPYRLPAEPGQPDFVWSDPENGVFVFRDGETLVYGSFFNLDAFNGRSVGDRGIYHLVRPESERLVEFPPDFALPESGLSVTVRYPFGDRIRPQTPPPPGMTTWASEPPDWLDHRAGRAYFYHTRTGPYVIAMNTTETGTYRESTWTLPAIPGATKARDLATGEIVDLSRPLPLPAYTSRFFILE